MRLRPTPSEPGGVWALVDGEPLRLDLESARPAVVLAPSEAISTLVVEMPAKLSRRERLIALPFAVEEAVAEPLEAVHVALGAELAPGRFLAAVIRHETMIRWTATLEAAGLGRAVLAPDYLRLPAPPEGGWSVEAAAGRALVRAADGTGFAAPADLLNVAWEAAARPTVVSLGEPLPGELAAEPAIGLQPRRLSAPLVDLRQGAYAVQGRPERLLLRRLAAVAAIGVAAHTVVLAADTWALDRQADARRAEVEALVRQTAPGLPVTADLAAELTARLGRGVEGGGPFLPLLARASAALRPIGSALTLRGLSYSAEGRLVLEVTARDLTGIQRAEAALDAAGLDASAGSANVTASGADGQLIVRPAGGAA